MYFFLLLILAGSCNVFIVLLNSGESYLFRLQSWFFTSNRLFMPCWFWFWISLVSLCCHVIIIVQERWIRQQFSIGAQIALPPKLPTIWNATRVKTRDKNAESGHKFQAITWNKTAEVVRKNFHAEYLVSEKIKRMWINSKILLLLLLSVCVSSTTSWKRWCMF